MSWRSSAAFALGLASCVSADAPAPMDCEITVWGGPCDEDGTLCRWTSYPDCYGILACEDGSWVEETPKTCPEAPAPPERPPHPPFEPPFGRPESPPTDCTNAPVVTATWLDAEPSPYVALAFDDEDLVVARGEAGYVHGLQLTRYRASDGHISAQVDVLSDGHPFSLVRSGGRWWLGGHLDRDVSVPGGGTGSGPAAFVLRVDTDFSAPHLVNFGTPPSVSNAPRLGALLVPRTDDSLGLFTTMAQSGQFGTFNVSGPADINVVLAQLNHDASFTSASAQVGTINHSGLGLAIDASDATVQTGWTAAFANHPTLFAYKHDAAATLLWTAACTSPSIGGDAVVDDAGNTYVAGAGYGDTVSCASGAPTIGTPNRYFQFVVKLGPDGGHLWTHQVSPGLTESYGSLIPPRLAYANGRLFVAHQRHYDDNNGRVEILELDPATHAESIVHSIMGPGGVRAFAVNGERMALVATGGGFCVGPNQDRGAGDWLLVYAP